MSETIPAVTPAATPSKAERYRAKKQRVPAFARFRGTSAWQKYPRRAREFQRFLTAERAAAKVATPSAS